MAILHFFKSNKLFLEKFEAFTMLCTIFGKNRFFVLFLKISVEIDVTDVENIGCILLNIAFSSNCLEVCECGVVVCQEK